MGKATSSIITVVPVRRTAPTAGNNPLRIFHNWLNSSGMAVNSMGRTVATLARAALICPIWASRVSAVSALVSTSTAVTFGPSSPRNSGMPGLPVTDARLARSISSAAATGCFPRIMVASQAVRMSGKYIRALALWRCSMTVR